jgi:hypothetical protein
MRLAAVTTAAVALSIVGVGVANADTTSGAISGTANSSDPEIIQCPDPGGAMTLCIFNSYDMQDVAAPYGAESNYYPMVNTVLYRLKAGTDPAVPGNWVNMSIIMNETFLYSRGVPSHAYHMWAPGVRYLDNGFYVFEPDVTDRSLAGESTSSRIFPFYTTDQTARLGYTYPTLSTPIRGLNTQNDGYASDPNLFVDLSSNRYLVYADGDYSNCGGISMGQLNSSMSNWASSPQPITINGFDASGLGDCGGTGHPYMEGPAVYTGTEVGAPNAVPFSYVMIFAAKPNAGVPSQCTKSKGQPGKDNEVIAYATAAQPTGPFDYQGIIMCGSATEWTNQASVAREPGFNGRYVMAWHDGPGLSSGFHNRKTHLSCLTWGRQVAGKIDLVTRSTTNLANC